MFFWGYLYVFVVYSRYLIMFEELMNKDEEMGVLGMFGLEVEVV